MNIGITLMVVGMVTVFSVLLIIIALSNLLINIVNKVAPEEQEKAKAAAQAVPQSEPEPKAPAADQEGEWVCFKARLTTPKALLLREFLLANNIEFLPIKEQKN